jgi:hypothetical protein
VDGVSWRVSGLVCPAETSARSSESGAPRDRPAVKKLREYRFIDVEKARMKIKRDSKARSFEYHLRLYLRRQNGVTTAVANLNWVVKSLLLPMLTTFSWKKKST